MNRDPEAWARLGRALSQTRQAKGLTQQDLADRAGVSLNSVQNAEAGTVPKARMPYTVPAIAALLGWPDGAIDEVLAGGEIPGGFRDVSVQKQIDAEQLETIISAAMVRATENATAAEIRAATKIALDELRRQGLL